MSNFLTDGGPAVKFEKVGDTFEGVVLSITEMDDRTPDGETKTWKDGSPKKVWVFNCEPSDGDETQSLWVRGNLVKVIRAAARDAKVRDLIGHSIKVQRLEDGTPTQRGYAPPKLYRAKVSPEVVKAVTSFTDTTVEDDEEPF